MPRTKQRSVTVTQTNVEPCFLKSKKPEPNLKLSCTQVPESQVELAAKSSVAQKIGLLRKSYKTSKDTRALRGTLTLKNGVYHP